MHAYHRLNHKDTMPTQRQEKEAALKKLYEPHRTFTKSPLYLTGCKNIVFGEGDLDATIMFIGEAPGKQEDEQGRPFVGPSGKLLGKALTLAGLSREEVFITNIVKCRPPNNRTPLPNELKTGKELMLLEQITIINPVILCTLGSAALRGLTEIDYRITQVHGQPLDFNGRILFPTFHPAYILRNLQQEEAFLRDIKKLAQLRTIALKSRG